MPLHLPTPPPGGLELVRSTLTGLLPTPSPSARALTVGDEAAAGHDLTAAAPHLVYFVGLDDVAQGRIILAAQPTCWRYVLLGGDEARAAAQLIVGDDGQVAGFSHVERGPFVQSTVAAVALAEQIEATRGGDYELRLLSVPSLYLVALWMHGVQDDLLVPLAPAPGGVETEGVYTEEQLFSALLELIERRAGTNDPMP